MLHLGVLSSWLLGSPQHTHGAHFVPAQGCSQVLPASGAVLALFVVCKLVRAVKRCFVCGPLSSHTSRPGVPLPLQGRGPTGSSGSRGAGAAAGGGGGGVPPISSGGADRRAGRPGCCGRRRRWAYVVNLLHTAVQAFWHWARGPLTCRRPWCDSASGLDSLPGMVPADAEALGRLCHCCGFAATLGISMWRCTPSGALY